jgi:hypothetical protein
MEKRKKKYRQQKSSRVEHTSLKNVKCINNYKINNDHEHDDDAM